MRNRIAIGLAMLLAIPSFAGAQPIVPTLPAELTLPTDSVEAGRKFRPTTASQFAQALRDARAGDVILLVPRSSYVGYFKLPQRPAPCGWVTVRTDGVVPAPGVRMTPEASDSLSLARIVAFGRNDPALHAMPASCGFRFVGVEFAVADTVTSMGTLLRIGDNSYTELSQVPRDIVFDRVYIHGRPTLGLTRCVWLNSAASAVVNSSVQECHRKGFDSNAIGVISSPGPLRIENNDLQGAGMGIFFGGSDPKILNLSPSDIVIRRNHVWRPITWKTTWTIKNLLEFKHGIRVLVEENVFENNWVAAQSGTAIVFKSTNQNGRCTWCQTADMTFRRNVVRHSPNGMSIAARPETYPATPAARFLIAENLFEDIGAFNETTGGRMLVISGDVRDISIIGNRLLHGSFKATHAIIEDTTAAFGGGQRLLLRDNLATLGTSGVFSSGIGQGIKSLTSMWRDTWTSIGNIWVGVPAKGVVYPVGDIVTPTMPEPAPLAGVAKAAITGIWP